MLRILNLKKAFGGQDVLKDVSFEIGDRERVALVGANGAGKSSLLKIVAGVLPPDEGSVRLQGEAAARGRLSAPGRRRAQWPQPVGRDAVQLSRAAAGPGRAHRASNPRSARRPPLATTSGSRQLIDRQGALLERFDQLGGYAIEAEVAKVLAGLGFASTDRDKPTADFSGGWQMRIALAKMLVRKPGLLLLDEPTNHLDLAACEWLEGYLADYPSLILVVSHDRYFLDRVTNRTIELDDGVATDYRGNYSHYLIESARRRAGAEGGLRPPAEVHRPPDGVHQRHQGQCRARRDGQEPREGPGQAGASAGARSPSRRASPSSSPLASAARTAC